MQCHSVSAKTRGDDIGRLKDQLENLVYFEDRNLYKDKASRGWEHNETARLLMPVGMLDEHEDDITRYVQYLTGDVFSPEGTICSRVMEGEIRVRLRESARTARSAFNLRVLNG